MDKQTLRRLLLGGFTWQRLIHSLIFIYIFFCLYVFFYADRMIFLPQPSSYRDNRDILKIMTDEQIQLSAVYLPNPASIYTILYIHGNAEDLGDIQSVLICLAFPFWDASEVSLRLGRERLTQLQPFTMRLTVV